jgi:beta-N-acetylhexosaminidase
MGAMSVEGFSNAWAGESAVRAVEAGVDILLLPMDVNQTINSIEEAVYSGRITEERINRSVEKIWEMKKEVGLLKDPFQLPFLDLEAIVGIPSHTQKASEIAEKSITIAKDENQLLPLKPEIIDSLAHIILSLDDGARRYIKSFSSNVNRTHGHVKEIFVNNPLSNLGREDILNQMEKIDQIVVSLVVRVRMDKGIATIDSTHLLLLRDLQKSNVPIVTFSFGSPYLQTYDMLETYVCVFGYGSISVEAAANVLWGRRDVRGVLPIDLDSTMSRGMGLKKKKKSNKWGR